MYTELQFRYYNIMIDRSWCYRYSCRGGNSCYYQKSMMSTIIKDVKVVATFLVDVATMIETALCCVLYCRYNITAKAAAMRNYTTILLDLLFVIQSLSH